MTRKYEMTVAPTKASSEAGIGGRVWFVSAMQVARTARQDTIVMNERGALLVVDEDGNTERHTLPYGALIYVEDGAEIKPGKVLASWCPYTRPIVAEKDSIVVFSDIIEGHSVARQVDEITGLVMLRVIERPLPKVAKNAAKELVKLTALLRKLRPRIILESEGQLVHCTRALPDGTQIYVQEYEEVQRGQIVARIPIDIAEDGEF